MRHFKLLFLAILSPFVAISQCNGPILDSWISNSPTNFTIEFTAPEAAESYNIVVSAQYDDFGPIVTPETMTFTGDVISGLNEVTLEIDQLNPNIGQLSDYYFSATLTTTCTNQEESSLTNFYLSQFSLLNDPGYNFEPYYFRPMTNLPDLTAEPFDTYIPISSGEAQEIASLSVFVDIGHTYNGDLSIELISPIGTSTLLLPFSNGLGGQQGMSVVFSDDATELLENNTSGFSQGVFLPAETLSLYEGESPEGVWIIRVVDNLAIDQGILFGAALIINGTPCLASVSGDAFYDHNLNGELDTDEPPYYASSVYNSIDDDYSGINFNGHYLDCSSIGTGQLSLNTLPPYHTASGVDFTTNLDDQLEGLNLPLSPIPGISDLVLDVFTLTPDRPGFENTYYVSYENIGTECISDVELSVLFEEVVTILGVDAANSSIVDNNVFVSIGELCPQESGEIQIQVINDETIEIGYELGVFGQLEPIIGDENTQNNTVHFISEVVGSFDPNDKHVNHTVISPGFIEAGGVLKYKVRFQNTGNYYAERVLVVDTIDPSLDPNTVVLLSHSHDVVVSNNGPVFYFEFDQIFLPDSTTDLAGSMGFFRYGVQPYQNTPNLTAIDNLASIFFDFNAPIITNTVSTFVSQANGLSELEFEASIFPNPATNQIQLELPAEAGQTTLRIVDVSGKEVQILNALGGVQTTIDVSSLESGLYIINFQSDVQIKPQAWIKQ